ncbi:MAG: tRNA pseudouridine(55) synthase TruB, partial [Clostridia bacterium]|nr:tRNA pseudouridine(55) synthase TruB [Clostridia bacterium]
EGSTYTDGRVKKKLNVKSGHMGTLEPMASVVLPVGLGKATRLFDFLLKKKKTYLATFEFGRLTDTLDGTGKTVKLGGSIPSKDEIMRVLGDFSGTIEQIPPHYSAVNVAGSRGYDLARRGVEFSLPPKLVTVDSIEILGRADEKSYNFKIDCRGGTYIRALARDLGEKLGTFATMTSLTRTAAGVFTLENSVGAEEFSSSDDPLKYVIPADEVVDYPKLNLTEHRAKKLLDGVFEKDEISDGLYRVYYLGEFWGIGEAADGILKIRAYCKES